ncbi:hypothetical protein M9435_006926 [Picochlorum sp. BPE23]|nr:hypothetical protein M9435_006926 [Picochlorum sp. BPE23]
MSTNVGNGWANGSFERGRSSSSLKAQLTPLWKGSFLLKHGRQGRPKVHYFQLSEDSMELVWTRSSGTRRSVPLSRVQDILLGQASPVFRKFPLKDEASSFSLVYDASSAVYVNTSGNTNQSSRTLDLTFLNKAQRDVWYQGLVEAARYAHQVMIQGQRPPIIRRDLGDMMMWGNVNFLGDDSNTFTNKAASPHKEYQGLEAMLPAGNTLHFCTSPSSSLPQSSIPLLIPSNNLLNIEKACVGHRHCVIQSAEGCVYSFGEGKNGKLGLGHDDDLSHPRKIEYGFDTLSSIVDVHLSNESSLAVTEDGRVYAWGKCASPIPSLLNSGVFSRIKIASVACGPYHCGGICSQGKLYTWGEGMAGKLGHGDVQSRSQPTLVADLPGVVQKVSCGLWHSAAIVRFQSEGDPPPQSQDQTHVEEVQRSPHHRHRRTLSHISSTFGTILTPDATIDCYREGRGGYLFTWGGAHSPCLQGQGREFCENNKGCLGHGEDTIYCGELAPRMVKGPLEGDSVKDVAAGSNFTAVISTAGAVYQMGSMGCIIQQSTLSSTPHPWEGAYSPVAVRGPLSNVFVDKIDCGLHHVVVAGRPFDRRSARPVGEVSSLVFAWGRGREGQLGQGKLEDSVFPVMIEALKSRHISSVACGSFCSSVMCKHNAKKIVSDFSRDAWDTASYYFNTLMERSSTLQGMHSRIEKTSALLHETESNTGRSLDMSSKNSFSRDSLHASLSRPSKSVISVSETSQSGDMRHVRRSIGQFASHHSLNSFSESWEAPSRYQSSSFQAQESSNSVEYTPCRWKKKKKSDTSHDAQDTATSVARPQYSHESRLESEKATLQEQKHILKQWEQELKDKEERLLVGGHMSQTIPEGPPSPSYCWTEELDQGVSATFTMKNGKQKLLRIRFSRDIFSPADVALWYELHQDTILTCTSPKHTAEQPDVSVTKSVSEVIQHIHFSRRNMSFDANELVQYHQSMQHWPSASETKNDDDDDELAEEESLVSAVSHPSQVSDTDESDPKASMISSVSNALWQLSLKAWPWKGQSDQSNKNKPIS